jgi:L-rhamnose mutarotase
MRQFCESQDDIHENAKSQHPNDKWWMRCARSFEPKPGFSPRLSIMTEILHLAVGF